MEEEDNNLVLSSTTLVQVVNITQDVPHPECYIYKEDYFNIFILAAEKITPSQMLKLTLTTNQL